MSQITHTADALKSLEEKRQALERLVVISHAVEHMNSGLQAALLMGKTTAAIPARMLAALAELDDKTRILPTHKLQESVGRLEQSVKARIQQIVHLATAPEAELQGGEAKGDMPAVGALLQEFRKNAQTVVALRVLLKGRGVLTHPLDIGVPEQAIRSHIGALGRREQQCRTQLTRSINTMLTDTQALLANPKLVAPMRDMVVSLRADLTTNLRHLEAGKSIETLPIALEIVELGDAYVPAAELAAPPLPAPPPAPAPSAAPPKPRGLLAAVLRWCTTPPQVTWSDVRHGRDRD